MIKKENLPLFTFGIKHYVQETFHLTEFHSIEENDKNIIINLHNDNVIWITKKQFWTFYRRFERKRTKDIFNAIAEGVINAN